MDQLRRVLATIQKNLGKLTVSHKLLIGSLAVILLMTLFLVSQYAGSAKMVELLPGASAEAQQKALAYLENNGLPHTSDGGKIMVPAEKQLSIVAALAEAGRLPEDSATTFKNVVERQNWMNPKSLNDQIYNNALENTLAQCLRNFKGIEKATVVIDAPAAQGLGAAVRKPTASVVVVTRGGAPLEAATVNAIAATVASAKAGMDVKNVSISDGYRHYTAKAESDFSASSYMEQVAKYEQYVRGKLAEHLEYIRGVSIAVNAQVDVRRTESRSRTIKPKGAGSETLTSKESNTTMNSKQASEGAAPGLKSNVEMSISRGGDGAGSETNETGDTEYATQFGSVDEAVIDPRGMATKINAAIGVPRDYVVALWQQANPSNTAAPTEADLKPVFDAEKQRLEADISPLIETDPRSTPDASGAVKAGTVVVSMIPVSIPGAGAGGPGGEGGTSDAGAIGAIGTMAMSGWMKTAVLGALAVVSLAMMMLMVRKASKPAAIPTAEELVGIPPALATNSDLIGEAEEGETPMVGIEIDDDTLKTEKMLQEVSEMVKTKPSDAAALLQRWVQTEV
jgi:flagellar biosynthesis/type III secretory pathway M-ring protein FliF/YscJ